MVCAAADDVAAAAAYTSLHTRTSESLDDRTAGSAILCDNFDVPPSLFHSALAPGFLQRERCVAFVHDVCADLYAKAGAHNVNKNSSAAAMGTCFRRSA